MIQLSANTPVVLATQPQDFRKGIDGFVALCRDVLHHNPKADCRFVFINRSRTMVRILAYDVNGYWLMIKRLSRGRFDNWPTAGKPVTQILAAQLRQLLKGNRESLNSTIKTSQKNTSVMELMPSNMIRSRKYQ